MGTTYSKMSKQWNQFFIGQLQRVLKKTRGWPPDAAWMRRYGGYILLTLAVPVVLSARRVLAQQFGGQASNALVGDFVSKELTRRLVSLREIIHEEKEREERKKAKAMDPNPSPTASDDDDDDDDDGDGGGAGSESDVFVMHSDSEDDEQVVPHLDEDLPLKVNDIVSAVNAVTQLDRQAPEVAEGWCLETAAERWWENDIRCCSQEMN